MIKKKIHVALLCFFTDLFFAIWSYFKLTNYEEYQKQIKILTTSPEIQVQVYQMFLQWVTVTLIVFLLFHLVVYYYFTKEKVSSIKYIRFYTFTAAASGILMIVTGSFIGIIPAAVYGLSFISTKKVIAKT